MLERNEMEETRAEDPLRVRDVSLSEFRGPSRLVVGWNATTQLRRIVDSFGAGSVLIIADQHVVRDSVVQSAIGELQIGQKITVQEHDGHEPSLEQASRVTAQVTSKIDVVIGIGGGSTIDTAKAVALAKMANEPLQKFEGADQVNVDPLPLIAVPTTAGTGSEVSGSCVLTDESSKRKISIRSSSLLPRVAILDPHFLSSVPKGVIRATGVDALGHAIEAYFSTSGNVLTDRLALGAMALLIKSLPRYYSKPTEKNAAAAMAWGSCMAGIAFNSARVGLAHAVASAIGPLTGLSHGICVGLALPAAIRVNLKSRAADRGELLFHLGLSAAEDQNWERAVLAKVAELYKQLEFPQTAGDAGRPFDVDDALISRIIASGRLETNPVRVGRDTLRDVLNSIRG